MTDLGVKIQNLMRQKGVTAYVVAEQTGISEATLGRIIKKNSKPQMKNVKLLANYFQVTTDYLLGEEVKVNPEKADLNFTDEVAVNYVIKNFERLKSTDQVFSIWIDNIETKAENRALKKEIEERLKAGK